MTAFDSAGRIPGYYDTPFPAEDGGPRRQAVARGAALGLRPGGRLEVTSRQVMFASMIVLRAPGEVYVQGNSPPASPNLAPAWPYRRARSMPRIFRTTFRTRRIRDA